MSCVWGGGVPDVSWGGRREKGEGRGYNYTVNTRRGEYIDRSIHIYLQ